MNFLSRALNYIKSNKVKHLLIFLLFTAVFAVTISVLIIYMSYSKQLDVLQTSLGQSITLQGIHVYDKYINGGSVTSVSQEDASHLLIASM